MLAHWDPFAEIARLQDSIFSRNLPTETRREYRPSVDIFEDEKTIQVKADLPGIKPEEIKIEVENGILTLSGERKLEKEDNKDGYHRVERVYGAFSRSFTLPEAVDGDAIEAKYNEGVLTVVLPKREEVNHRKEIKVTH
jgi:HSP20 family protein